MLLLDCENVQVRDVTMKDTYAWNLVFFFCDSVLVHGIRVRSERGICNADGIDLVASSNCRISDCDIICEDDAICLKNILPAHREDQHLRRVCRNIMVTGCTISTNCNAFKLGTDSEDGFENISLSNCVFYSNEPEDPTHCTISGIALEVVDGGCLRGVTISNVVMHNVRAPIFIRIGNRGRGQDVPKPGRLEDVHIDNVVAWGANICSTITGQPGYDVRNVSLTNVRIEVLGGQAAQLAENEPPERPDYYPEATMFGRLPSYGLYCRHVDGLTLSNVALGYQDIDGRPAMMFDDVKNANVAQLSIPLTEGSQPAVRLVGVRGLLLTQSRIPTVECFAQIEGADSEAICFAVNDDRNAARVYECGEDVSPETVVVCECSSNFGKVRGK